MHNPFDSYSPAVIKNIKLNRVDASAVLNCDSVNFLLLAFAWIKQLPTSKLCVLDSRLVNALKENRQCPPDKLNSMLKRVTEITEPSEPSGLLIKSGCLLLVPINAHFHWSLLVCTRGEDNTSNAWVHYDSIGSHLELSRNVICKRLAATVFGKHSATFESPAVPLQAGAYECGYFLLLYAWRTMHEMRILSSKQIDLCTQTKMQRFKTVLSSLLDRLILVARRREADVDFSKECKHAHKRRRKH